jgi:hypothetical protein
MSTILIILLAGLYTSIYAIHDLFVNIDSYINVHINKKKIKMKIKMKINNNKNLLSSYLAGLFEGDGHI